MTAKKSLALRLPSRTRASDAPHIASAPAQEAPSPAACRPTRTIALRRFLALPVAAITMAGVVTFAAESPASAQTPGAVCLTNADSYCLGIGGDEIVHIVVTAIDILRYYFDIYGTDP
jgi:hypothetical protein